MPGRPPPPPHPGAARGARAPARGARAPARGGPRPPPGLGKSTAATRAKPPARGARAPPRKGSRGPPPGLARPARPRPSARPAAKKPAAGRGSLLGSITAAGGKTKATSKTKATPTAKTTPSAATKATPTTKTTPKAAASKKQVSSLPPPIPPTKVKSMKSKPTPAATKTLAVKKTSSVKQLRKPTVERKKPEENELAIKQKNRKIREQIDDAKDLIRKEKKDAENASKVKAMQTKIQEIEAKIKQLEPISSLDLNERLAVVVEHVKGGTELKDLSEKTKEADAQLADMAKQRSTANTLVKESSAKLTAQRNNSSGVTGSSRKDVVELREQLEAYQSRKHEFVNASKVGLMSSGVILQMQRLIRQCDNLNEKEDKLSAELVTVEKNTSKAMGEAWQQTAVHKFKLDVGMIPPADGKEAKLLEMEEEHGNSMLEDRDAVKARIIARLNSEQVIFDTLAASHDQQLEFLETSETSEEQEYTDRVKAVRRHLGQINHKYRAGKQYEKQVLHEFEKLKVAYLAGYHQDITEEQKLQRKADRRRKLLDDHLDNIKAAQDRIVSSVEEDWAQLIEREEKRGEADLAAKRKTRVSSAAKLRIDIANKIESTYKPTVVELITNNEALGVQADALKETADEVEQALRACMTEQKEVDTELALLRRMMEDGPSNNPEELQKNQRKLRNLWKQGAVPMSQVEIFLSQLADHADPTEMLMTLYEHYLQKVVDVHEVPIVATGDWEDGRESGEKEMY